MLRKVDALKLLFVRSLKLVRYFFLLIATFSHYYIMLLSNRVKDYINHAHTPIIDIKRTITWPILY